MSISFWVKSPAPLVAALLPLMVAALLLVGCSRTAAVAPGERLQTPEETARHEAGLRAARQFFEAYDKAVSGAKSLDDYDVYFDAMLKASAEFRKSLQANGKEGIEAAEGVALAERLDKNKPIPREFWETYLEYLTGPATYWGLPHLNDFLRCRQLHQLPPRSVACLLDELTKCHMGPSNLVTEMTSEEHQEFWQIFRVSNWLDEEVVLPLLQPFFNDTSHYATWFLSNGKKSSELRIRVCDQGVMLLCRCCAPEGLYSMDETETPDPDADRRHDEQLEAAKKWVETRLSQLAARREVLAMAASYHRLGLSRAQIDALLEAWAGMAGRSVRGKVRDVRALANVLLADLRRTGERDRVGIEKEFHRAAHERLAAMLAKAGYRQEGPAPSAPRNLAEEREELFRALQQLARGTSDPAMQYNWVLYEWARYRDELGAADKDSAPQAAGL